MFVRLIVFLVVLFCLLANNADAIQIFRDDFNGPSYSTTGWVKTDDPHAGANVTFENGYMKVSAVCYANNLRAGSRLDKTFSGLTGDFEIKMNMSMYSSNLRETYVSIYTSDGTRAGYFHIYDVGTPYDGKVRKRVYVSGAGATSFQFVNQPTSDTITFSRSNGELTASYGNRSISGSFAGEINRVQLSFKTTKTYGYGTDHYDLLTVDDFASIPEPATMFLLGLGLVGLIRRKTRK